MTGGSPVCRGRRKCYISLGGGTGRTSWRAPRSRLLGACPIPCARCWVHCEWFLCAALIAKLPGGVKTTFHPIQRHEEEEEAVHVVHSVGAFAPRGSGAWRPHGPLPWAHHGPTGSDLTRALSWNWMERPSPTDPKPHRLWEKAHAAPKNWHGYFNFLPKNAPIGSQKRRNSSELTAKDPPTTAGR